MFKFTIYTSLLGISLLTIVTIDRVQAKTLEEIQAEQTQLLSLNLDQLMNQEVSSAAKKTEKLVSAAANIVVINADTLQRMGSKTLSEVLWTVAGLQVQNRNNNRHAVWIRGVQSRYNKVALFIDGVPFRDFFGGVSLDEEIPLENIKQIEIIRGPGSTLYGANAFSGVINIFTYNAGEKEHNNLVKTEIGNNQSQVGYFRVEDSTAMGHFQVQGKYFDTDGQTPKFDRTGKINNTDPAAQTLNHLEFKAASPERNLQLKASFSEFQNRNVNKGHQRPSDRTYERTLFSLNYAHDFNEQLKAQFNAYYTRYDRFEDERTYDIIPSGLGALNTREVYVDNIAMTGLNSTFEYLFGEKDTLIAGFEMQREETVDSYFTVNGERDTFVVNPQYQDLTNYGLFLQNTHAFIPEKRTLTTGIRYDILDSLSNQLSYRLSFFNAFSKQLSAKLLYGTAYRSPSFLESTRSETDFNVQELSTVEAQITYYQEEASYTLSTFYNQYKETTRLQVGPEEVAPNSDQSIYGIELETRFNLSTHLSSFANLAWLRAEYDVTGDKVPLLADWTAVVGLDWKQPIAAGEWGFHTQAILYDKRKDWPPSIWQAGQQQRYAGWTQDLTDGFMVWNSNVYYKGLNGWQEGLTISFSINNMLDEEYFTQDIIPPRSDRIAWFDVQYDQRQYYLSIGYEW
jgi:iron complex outermembrane receptor protein